MYKFLLAILGIFALVKFGYSQKALNTSTKYASQEGTRILWSVGEAITQATISGNHVVTHGFCQPSNIVKPGVKPLKLQVALYPVPVKNVVNFDLKIDNLTDISVRILTHDGSKTLIEKVVRKSNSQFQMSAYPSGTYLFCIFRKTTLLKTFKLLKK